MSISRSEILRRKKRTEDENIARGTMEPEIDYVTWTKIGNHMSPHVLVANFATCIHQEPPLASVANWVPKWHNLDWFKIWSSGGATCIVCKVLSLEAFKNNQKTF